ncbi:DUF2796 domain-containing protein [Nitrosomonas marina]|uniref:DUF2796 domain-containing protein n=1 Tax=Nitrosomonas marina TaxID=917 RepID=A0A1H8DDW1_9PROT|nr:DUF2796 domain-containing protein [Nitrosomonas marina]SEN04677.1 Protein of unknown function [Nitrosomonas marina]
MPQKKRIMLRKSLATGWLLLFMSYSPDNHSSEGSFSHGHGAHVHGSASLRIVLDNNLLFIEFDSPAFNLVGFEHEPANEAQKSALLTVKQALDSAELLFRFTPTRCRREKSDIEVPYIAEHYENHPRSYQHDHVDIHANYVFQCARAEKLKTISVNLFTYFPGIQEIRVQWIFENRQGVAILTADNPGLKFD